eukprot:465501-Amphidinium_carterae.1
MNAESRCGLDPWRRLSRRFDCSSTGRKRTMLNNVLQPGSFEDKNLRQAIEQHERLVQDFEQRRSSADGNPKQLLQLDEDIRIRILQEMIRTKPWTISLREDWASQSRLLGPGQWCGEAFG